MRDFKVHRVNKKGTKSASSKPVMPSAQQKKSTNSNDVQEIGGPKGPEPTRYGDWEQGGRCTDF